jgi:hypothetical protein
MVGSANSNASALDTDALPVSADFHTPAQPVVFTLKVPFHFDHRWSTSATGTLWYISWNATSPSAQDRLTVSQRSVEEGFRLQ